MCRQDIIRINCYFPLQWLALPTLGLQMASVRAEKKFPPSTSDNPEEQVKPLLDWANGGFLPKGEEGLKPTHTAGNIRTHIHTHTLAFYPLTAT